MLVSAQLLTTHTPDACLTILFAPSSSAALAAEEEVAEVAEGEVAEVAEVVVAQPAESA